MHRTTLTERHTVLSAHELGNDALDGTTSEDGESVASVRGDDPVLAGDGGLHADGNGFLADGKVAEASDKLLLVKGVGGLLHSSHLDHGAVHVDQLVLGDGGLGRRGIASVRVERVGVELDLERLGTGGGEVVHGGGLVGVDLHVAHLGEGGTERLGAEGAGGGAEATGTEGEGHGCRRGGWEVGGGRGRERGRNNKGCAADGSTEQGRIAVWRGRPRGGICFSHFFHFIPGERVIDASRGRLLIITRLTTRAKNYAR